jgi:hypothetical protein
LFNSDFDDWYFGVDGETPAGQYDFVSVVLHELGHGLGFSGSATVDGNLGSWGLGSGFPFIYDVFVENGAGEQLIDTTIFPNPSEELADQLQGGDLYFAGPAATMANDGEPPELYAPDPWLQGSSYSHLDEDAFPAGDPNSLMTPALDTAEAIHNPGAITRGIFTDQGWTIEPPTAITLNGLSATATSHSVPLLTALGALVVLAGLVVTRRKR